VVLFALILDQEKVEIKRFGFVCEMEAVGIRKKTNTKVKVLGIND